MDPTKKPQVFLIIGPTASGKTAASIEVAKRINAEIISADSIQVYKGLDIGSAKPSFDEMKGVPHHLLDFVEIDDTSYNVTVFRELALQKIKEIHERGKRVLIVGGTGLYVNSLIFPLNFTKAEPDFERRKELEQLESEAPGSLHKILESIDRVAADRLHVNDTKRIIRAIEVYEQTGKTMTDHGGDFANENGVEIEFDPVIAGITMDREMLYRRIEKRVDNMIEQGLLAEVDVILQKGFSSELPALQGLGYKQLIMFRKGLLSLDEAIALIKRDTRRFAKRQISWFKRDKRIQWFNASAINSKIVDEISEYFISKIKR